MEEPSRIDSVDPAVNDLIIVICISIAQVYGSLQRFRHSLIDATVLERSARSSKLTGLPGTCYMPKLCSITFGAVAA